MRSWLDISEASPFSIHNLPFGVITTPDEKSRRTAVAIGDHALDLFMFSLLDGFRHLPREILPSYTVFAQPILNDFAALGRPVHRAVREYLQNVLAANTDFPDILRDNADTRKRTLYPLSEVTNYVPFRIGDYTDFYAGLNHAYNVGVLFRGPDNALQPNYRHLPVGYHGRASSIVPSGTDIRRPNGQILLDPSAKPPTPVFSACRKLDFELELGAFVCKENAMGQPVAVDEAEEHIFGYVLMNDWSARDIQAWEYVPLGPFNAKNFGTTISPWVVLADALEPFRALGLDEGKRDQLLPYLREHRKENVMDIKLEVEIETRSGARSVVTNTSGKNLLFSFPQMLAHHTSTGCNMNVGDLLGSGTISGTEPGSQGSLLEQTESGKKPIKITENEERRFLEDGDEVIFRGFCGEKGSYVGFGDCRGIILPALQLHPES